MFLYILFYLHGIVIIIHVAVCLHPIALSNNFDFDPKFLAFFSSVFKAFPVKILKGRVVPCRSEP